MAQEHSPFYKQGSPTYKVNIYQYQKVKGEYSADIDPIASFCCAHCKMWQQCELDDEKNQKRSKQDICYIAKEVETKMSNFICGFSSGLSNSDFMLKPENKDQEKSIDKLRKRFLKKYKMHQNVRS